MIATTLMLVLTGNPAQTLGACEARHGSEWTETEYCSVTTTSTASELAWALPCKPKAATLYWLGGSCPTMLETEAWEQRPDGTVESALCMVSPQQPLEVDAAACLLPHAIPDAGSVAGLTFRWMTTGCEVEALSLVIVCD